VFVVIQLEASETLQVYGVCDDSRVERTRRLLRRGLCDGWKKELTVGHQRQMKGLAVG